MKRCLSIILFIFSQAVCAQSAKREECAPLGIPPVSELIKSIMAPLALWTSTDVQMQNAPCKTKAAPTITAMDQVIATNSQGTPQSKNINGVTLTDDPKMLKMFERFTTNYSDLKNQKNFQSLFSINPACNKVSCALEKIWGNRYSKQMSYLYLHFGFNSSEYSFFDASRFTEAEMDDVLIALSDFPRKMVPLAKENRQLIHYTRGTWNPDYRKGTFASSDVQVYDPWTKTNSMERQQTIFHEVTHMLAEAGSIDASAEWLNLSDWKEIADDKWITTNKKCMVGRYGSTNPGEDFAESAVAFRYNPSRLYQGCPAKYQYMKKFFKGLEYFVTASCKENK